MLENNQKELILLEDLGMIYPKETSKQKKRYGLYKCYCGNEFKAQVQDIRKKATVSCGCYNKQKTKESNTKHGLTKHKLYNIWFSMIDRCKNSKSISFVNYGGRGISVCDEWLNITNFIEDMYPSYMEGLSIDRIDNNLGYSKDNCRWVERNIQARNTRLLMSTNTSGYRGIHFNKLAKKWTAQIAINNKSKHLGYFYNAIEAAKAYDKYIIDNNLEHTRNFN